jgi:hypothetical protein
MLIASLVIELAMYRSGYRQASTPRRGTTATGEGVR